MRAVLNEGPLGPSSEEFDDSKAHGMNWRRQKTTPEKFYVAHRRTPSAGVLPDGWHSRRRGMKKTGAEDSGENGLCYRARRGLCTIGT